MILPTDSKYRVTVLHPIFCDMGDSKFLFWEQWLPEAKIRKSQMLKWFCRRRSAYSENSNPDNSWRLPSELERMIEGNVLLSRKFLVDDNLRFKVIVPLNFAWLKLLFSLIFVPLIFTPLLKDFAPFNFRPFWGYQSAIDLPCQFYHLTFGEYQDKSYSFIQGYL